ncbi:hypothetical protein BCO37747_06906 [Burkholderia contaminans]|nr:hypothetical protein BCO23253_06540 [Burkholderia contaminans]VWD57818.1 hypothetical protein BCO37747_06906 [Burkholderia contaminans]
MNFWLNGAAVWLGPVYAWFTTCWSPSALIVSCLPGALTHGPAPAPIASPVTLEIAGVASGYAQSGWL